jgi:hypothetical protein
MLTIGNRVILGINILHAPPLFGETHMARVLVATRKVHLNSASGPILLLLRSGFPVFGTKLQSLEVSYKV